MHEVLLSDGVEHRDRLVQQQHARLHHQHAGQVEQLALPARKLARLLAKPTRYAQEMAQLCNDTAHLLLRHAQVLQAKGQLMPYGVAYDLRVWVLRHVAHGCRCLGRRQLVDRRSGQQHAAATGASGAQRRHGAAHERRLAAAGSAHEHGKLPLPNRPVDAA